MNCTLRTANSIFLIALTLLGAIVPYGFLSPSAAANATTEEWEQALTSKQSGVRTGAFGTAYANQFVRLSLSAPPQELQQVGAVGPGGEPAAWTTVYLGPEMISDAGPGELTPQQVADLNAIRAEAHLIVGTLHGPNGDAHAVALFYSVTDENDLKYYHLVPIGEASAALITTLTAMTHVVQVGPIAQSKSPCDSLTHCHDLYRGRISDALRAFARCMKGQAPPLSLCVVACIVLCVPFLAGTPAAYLACFGGCAFACSGIGVVEWKTCEDALEAARANAKGSYCTCVAWKQANCNLASQEIDIVGCP